MDIRLNTGEPTPVVTKVKKNNKHKALILLMFLVVILALCLSGYFYYKLQSLENNIDNKQETKDLLSKVAKLYLIPTGEEPTIATVSDPEALRNKSFFTQSQKGDKVLIFIKAGKAVLYRPSINKIIEIVPINNQNKDVQTKPEEKTTNQNKDKTF